MLYADDAGVVSQSPGQLRKMMRGIVVVCAVFGLTVSEAKTGIMCLRPKGVSESAAILSVKAAGQVYSQTNKLLCLGGISVTVRTCPSKSTSAYVTHGAASGSTPSNGMTDRARSKSRCYESRYS